MGIAALLDVGDQFVGNFIVSIPLAVLLLPGTQVQFVDVQWLVIAPGTIFHPLFVSEFVFGQIPNDGAGTGAQLHAEAIGVAMLLPSVLTVDHQLVHLSRFCVGGKASPDTALMKLFQRFFCPTIKLANHRYFLCIGGIGAEHHTTVLDLRSEVFVGIKGLAHVEFLQIHKSSFPIHLCRFYFCAIIA